jgi:hypothetical protein
VVVQTREQVASRIEFLGGRINRSSCNAHGGSQEKRDGGELHDEEVMIRISGKFFLARKLCLDVSGGVLLMCLIPYV